MNKQAFLEETYNSAFEDELEKIAFGEASKLRALATRAELLLKKRKGAKSLLESFDAMDAYNSAFVKMDKYKKIISKKLTGKPTVYSYSTVGMPLKEYKLPPMKYLPSLA